MKTIVAGLAASAIALSSVAATAAQCTNDGWNKVMERGRIVIGVKADYKPWGFRNDSGELVGMEIAVAEEIIVVHSFQNSEGGLFHHSGH